MSYTIHFLLVSLYLATRLFYPNPPHLLSLPCLSCLPLHLNPTVLLSQQLLLTFFITPRRSRSTSLHLPLLVSILALCDDIDTNPGPSAPSSFSLCTYNMRSHLANDHTSALNYLIETHHPNIIALTKIWIKKSSTSS